MGCSLILGCLAAAPALRAEPAPRVDRGTFLEQERSAEARVLACQQTSAACDATSLPPAEQVDRGGNGGTFHVGWQWLRDALVAARTASVTDREANMRAAQARLAEEQAEAGGPARLSPSSFQQARVAANHALARAEFQAAEGPTWLQRQWAQLQDWLLRFFTGMDRLGKRAPWLAPLIEWSCFLLAASGLLWFVRQSLARQALRIALGEGAALAQRTGQDAADWARLAETHAAAAHWREAVHCLYWASIALLEGRRAWRPNTARTPREYLRLLRPGSEAQQSLRELTRAFERVWYGQTEADEGQYLAVRALFRALESWKPERAFAADPAPASLLAAAGDV